MFLNFLNKLFHQNPKFLFKHTAKFGGVTAKFSSVTAKFSGVTAKFSGVTTKFGGIPPILVSPH